MESALLVFSQIRALWNSDGISEESPVGLSRKLITTGIVTKVISRVGSEKADMSSATVLEVENWHSQNVWS